MFDAEYFKEHLPKQVRELGSGCCSVAVHLSDGSRFLLKGLEPEGILGGYVLAEVFPLEGITKKSKGERRKPNVTNEVSFDRIALPYEQITRVFLTVAPVEETPQFIGFPTA